MRLISSFALTLALALPAPAGPLTAGAAAVDITPPNGCPLAGYYSPRGAEGTRDPLFAKALVLEQGGTAVALVSLDLLLTTRDVVEGARKLVEQQTGIPGPNVMISATHSHTGPVLWDERPRPDAPPGGKKIVKTYLAELPDKIAAAVKKAHAARVPVRASFGCGKELGLAFNRRFHMADGSVGWNPGKKNPQIVRPAGPTDPTVPVVLFETVDKSPKPVAVYVNFAMHLDTVGGTHYSADYPHALAKALAAAVGDDVVTVFTIGTCGDVNHIDVRSDRPQKGPGEAARIGTRLAAEALRTLDALKPTDGTLRVSRATVELELPPVTAEQTLAAKGVLAALEKGSKPVPAFLDQVQALKAVEVSERLGKPYQVEVQVISLGDLAWVSLPGEIFVELGLQIKRGSPFRQTMIAELANGSVGYVPNRAAYPQGAYEVVSARVAEGSGERLVDAALKQLRAQFKDGKK